MIKATKTKRTNKADARARRFALHAPVRYRAADGRCWHDGTIENISRSGLLLRAAQALTPNTPVELVVELPLVIPGERSASVMCRGCIVRTAATHDLAGTVLAATITHYRIGRLDSTDH
jgi:hypothetical protein